MREAREESRCKVSGICAPAWTCERPKDWKAGGGWRWGAGDRLKYAANVGACMTAATSTELPSEEAAPSVRTCNRKKVNASANVRVETETYLHLATNAVHHPGPAIIVGHEPS